MVGAEEVQEVIFNFTQRCFIGEKEKQNLNMKKEKGLFDRLALGSLSQVEAHQMSNNHRKLLRELLTQYTMFLQMNRQLKFPEGFLADSNENILGEQLLSYICEHRWPFPQLLTKS